MEFIFLLIFIIIVIAVILKVVEKSSSDSSTKNQPTGFDYVSRNSVMTQNEINGFRVIDEALGKSYYVFPQIHLSSLLDSQVVDKKTKWSAHLHINRKSVDYVVCDRATLKPVCAIELDDRTHDWKSRIERDELVERILAEARMPLIRIKTISELDTELLIQNVSSARKPRGLDDLPGLYQQNSDASATLPVIS